MNPWRRSLAKSFLFAAQGIEYTLRTQRNLQFHFAAGLGVVLLSFFLDIGTVRLCLLIISMAIVIAFEMLNTAVECIVDLVQPEYHPLAKAAKDTAAAAVLASAVFAVCIGALILLPEVIEPSSERPLRRIVLFVLCAIYLSGFIYSIWCRRRKKSSLDHE